MKRQKELFLIFNFTVPLLVGAMIYYFLSPDVVFVKIIDELIGKRPEFLGATYFNLLLKDYYVVKLARCYLLDGLWGYALVFALYYIFSNNTANLTKIFFMAFAFSTFLEILQLTSLAKGTFDFIDIGALFLAEIFAVFIIKILMRRQ